MRRRLVKIREEMEIELQSTRYNERKNAHERRLIAAVLPTCWLRGLSLSRQPDFAHALL